MITNQRKNIVDDFEYTYYSNDCLVTFVCDCCKKEKKSKKYAEAISNSGQKKRICNGCYGLLIAKYKK